MPSGPSGFLSLSRIPSSVRALLAGGLGPWPASSLLPPSRDCEPEPGHPQEQKKEQKRCMEAELHLSGTSVPCES